MKKKSRFICPWSAEKNADLKLKVLRSNLELKHIEDFKKINIEKRLLSGILWLMKILRAVYKRHFKLKSKLKERSRQKVRISFKPSAVYSG